MINGEYVKAIRKKKNITRSALSADIGCTASYLSQIERGLREPSLPMLRKLSEALNIPMEGYHSVESGTHYRKGYI